MGYKFNRETGHMEEQRPDGYFIQLWLGVEGADGFTCNGEKYILRPIPYDMYWQMREEASKPPIHINCDCDMTLAISNAEKYLDDHEILDSKISAAMNRTAEKILHEAREKEARAIARVFGKR